MSSEENRTPLPAFIPLLAAYPVIYLASANPGQVTWTSVAAVTTVSVVVALLCYAALRLLVNSRAGAGVATVLLVVMFYSYGQVSGWIDAFVESLRLGDHETPNALDLFPAARLTIALAWAALALAGAWLVARSQWARRVELTKALNLAAVALLVMASASPLFNSLKVGSGGRATAAERPASAVKPTEPASRPDVYFIVLDGYARADVLARHYGYDNAPFLLALQGRGFSIGTDSSVNYNWTFLSLSSMLNLGYVHDIFAGQLGPRSLDRSIVYDRIRDNETARFLRERGYRIVHLQSTWGATSLNPYADRQVRCQHSVYANEFVRAVAEASWLGSLSSKAGADLARCHLSNFAALSRMGDEPGPKFVFAHFVLPHHPYLFDREGNVLRNAVVSNQFEFQKRLWEDRDSYRAQLEFVNRKVVETLDAILARSAQPPIIVLVSDHGPGFAKGLTSQDHLAVRFASLAAYHLPGAPKDLIPASGTAVNQFRRILSFYFDAQLPPLPDRHFMSATALPYDFREVPHELLGEWWTAMRQPLQAGPTERFAAEHHTEPTDAQIHH